MLWQGAGELANKRETMKKLNRHFASPRLPFLISRDYKEHLSIVRAEWRTVTAFVVPNGSGGKLW